MRSRCRPTVPPRRIDRPKFVIPANAGIHGRAAAGGSCATSTIATMDPGVRRDDETGWRYQQSPTSLPSMMSSLTRMMAQGRGANRLPHSPAAPISAA
ncbi:hypothetical protein D9602_02060 [Sphingomonas sp. TX0522]|nr:hypothetical protein [Sphingomonas sp. TX0522]